MFVLKATTRMVGLVFTFSSYNLLPELARKYLEQERSTDNGRHHEEDGDSDSQPVRELWGIEQCLLEGFVDSLLGTGYQLVDLRYRVKTDPKHTGRVKPPRTFHILSYYLARTESAKASDEFRGWQTRLCEELVKRNRTILWNVRRTDDNEYHSPIGEITDGQRVLEINLNGRLEMAGSISPKNRLMIADNAVIAQAVVS